MNVSINWSIRNIIFILALGLIVLVSTYHIAALGDNGFLILGVIVGGAVGILSLINFRFGFYTSIILGFLIFLIGRLTGDAVPTGLIVDIQINATFVGLLVHKVVNREPFFKNANHIITWAYLLYTLFLVVQIMNPSMDSFEGWLLVVRKFLQFVMIYFVALNIFTDMKKIRFFFIFWICCAAAAGAYGCYQEWFGLFQFEMDWIWSVPGRAGLYSLDNGNFRKFSTLSGPAAYGILMAASSLLLCIFTLKSKGLTKKLLYAIAATFVIMGMAYAGTRTAFFIFTAGAILYILMTITNKSTLITACVFFMAFVVIIFGPIYGNPTVNRIRTTFEFSDDASMAVRDVNRKAIQPYIYRHPIGGGLATSGLQGLQYNPHHYLATFPPDSGFVKTVVETGWIGFFFQCSLYCLILLSGVRVFYRTQDRIAKLYSLVAVVTIFSFVISQYGQVSIGQIPDCFLFYSLLAVIASLHNMYVSKKSVTNQKQPV